MKALTTNSRGLHKIAITGMSSLLPGSHNPNTFWKNIVEAKDLITSVPMDYWGGHDYFDPTQQREMTVYSNRGGFLDPVKFDPMEFGVPPTILPVTDSVQLLALITARDVLKDTVSYVNNNISKERISVILGVAAGTENFEYMGAKVHWPEVQNVLRKNGFEEDIVQKLCKEVRDSYAVWNENTFPGLLSNVVAGRISNRFDFGGTNCTMDAACASSLSAIKNAVQELQLGDADMVITGGADALNSIFMYMCFNQTGALSKSGDCRAFSALGDGTILGEGLAFFTLRRLEDAIKDQDRIYAVISGIGSSSDGKSKSIYAPDSKGQSKAILRALEAADSLASEIELIETHGTGTIAGDYAEFNGLKLAFDSVEKQHSCAIGSVKSQIGHTKSTAGAASMHKAALAIYNKTLPPTIKVDKPNEQLQIKGSPFYINTLARPWLTEHNKRKAGVSSFGFGGTNYHCILEEHLQKTQHRHLLPGKMLFCLSAESSQELISKVLSFEVELNSTSFYEVSKNTQVQFNAAHQFRLTFFLESKKNWDNLKQKLVAHLNEGKSYFEIPTIAWCECIVRSGKLAVLCSGQGSQYLNMGRTLTLQFPTAFEAYQELASIKFENRSIHEVNFPVPVFTEEEKKDQTDLLNQTQWSQPAIGNLTIAHKRLLELLKVQPDMLAGHSFGELSALHIAGVIQEPEDLIKIARTRAESMLKASTEKGAMTAVFLNGEETNQLINEHKLKLEIANFNSPKQTVVTGIETEIDKLENLLTTKSIEFRRLPVKMAFHSSLIKEAESLFNKQIQSYSFKSPKIPVYSNIDAKIYSKSTTGIAKKLASQLTSPVYFVDQIHAMYNDGATIFLEIGPGNNLSNLVKQILPVQQVTCLSLDGSKSEDSAEAFWKTVGRLCVSGIPLHLESLWNSLIAPPPEKIDYSSATVEIKGTNFQKPFPEKTGLYPINEPKPIQQTINTKTETKELIELSKSLNTNQKKIMEKENSTSNPTLVNTNKYSQQQLPVASSNRLGAFQLVQQSMHLTQLNFMKMMADNQNYYLQVVSGMLSNSGELSSPSPINLPLPLNSAVPSWNLSTIDLPQNQELNQNFQTQPTSIVPQTVSEVILKTIEKPEAIEQKNGSSFPDKQNHLKEEQYLKTELQTNGKHANGHYQSEVKETIQAVISETSADSMEKVLLEIVADKTGYPVEVLELETPLESGLGIDSIKRVEILSALQKKYPELLTADTAKLAKMNTLGEILNYASGSFQLDDKKKNQESSVII